MEYHAPLIRQGERARSNGVVPRKLSPEPGVTLSTNNRCRKQVLLLVGSFFFVGTMSYYSFSNIGNGPWFPQHSFPAPLPERDKIIPGFLVYTPGCKLPDLDPMDAAVRKFVYKPKPVSCGNKEALTSSNGTTLYFKDAAISGYGIQDRASVSCCYHEVSRLSQDANKYDSAADRRYRISKKCVEFQETVEVSLEFLLVRCRQGNKTIYQNFHSFVPVKAELEERCKKNRKVFRLENGMKEEDGENKESISVLMLGIDAVSRLNFFRTMPKTKEYLLKEMKAVDISGYNKVGDNTFPNLVAIMMGHSESEMAKLCWPKPSSKMDDCPWLWKNYSKAGYRTFFAEDSTWMGAFTYLKTGFVTQPVDYYMRPQMLASEEMIGHEKHMNANLCQGPKLTAQVMLDYVKEIARVLASKLYFGFMWCSSLSHDYLNYPMLGDSLWLKMLSELNESGYLNNTVLIMLSDHGIRWGGIRETYQGKMEERLPYVFFIFPEWFRQIYKTAVYNLEANSHKLSSPYDMHETLKDFINLQSLNKDMLMKRARALTEGEVPRGISLFLPIPENRTCNQSGIEDHWCTCQLSYPVSLNDTTVIKSSHILLESINSMLRPYVQCAQLKLSELRTAQIQVPKEVISKNMKKHITDYFIVMETVPGKALFEGTVRHNPEKNSYDIPGSISRINRYGDQSRCVAEYHMKKYCYCGT